MSKDLKNDIPPGSAAAAGEAPRMRKPIIVDMVESAEWRARQQAAGEMRESEGKCP